MSTILEALKKSEQERKLNKLPTLSDMPVPQEPSKWPLVLGALLSFIALLMLLVTVFWWGKGSMQPQVLPVENAPVVLKVQAAEGSADAQSSDDVVVNVISFSEDEAQRFTMINGKMVREGDYVRGGLKVEKILMDSVILNLRGKQITRKP